MATIDVVSQSSRSSESKFQRNFPPTSKTLSKKGLATTIVDFQEWLNNSTKLLRESRELWKQKVVVLSGWLYCKYCLYDEHMAPAALHLSFR